MYVVVCYLYINQKLSGFLYISTQCLYIKNIWLGKTCILDKCGLSFVCDIQDKRYGFIIVKQNLVGQFNHN